MRVWAVLSARRRRKRAAVVDWATAEGDCDTWAHALVVPRTTALTGSSGGGPGGGSGGGSNGGSDGRVAPLGLLFSSRLQIALGHFWFLFCNILGPFRKVYPVS